MANKIAVAVIAVIVIAAVGYILFSNGNFLNSGVNSAKATTTIHRAASSTSTIETTVSTTTVAPTNITTYNATKILDSNTPISPLIRIALENYRAPYCQGDAQAPVGSNGLPCAAEENSTDPTFNSTSGAFDCAGFVQYIYSQFGVKLPRTAQAQFGNFYPAAAQTVNVIGGQANTVAGDLVYFSIPGDHDPEPAHVAMCFDAGCNTIIQNGGPHTGMPGSIAPLNAELCTNPNSSTARCIMGFDRVEGFTYPANSSNRSSG